METINTLIKILRNVIIPLGVTFRVVICLVQIMYNEDEASVYKKRIKNILLFGILAEVILNIKNVIEYYF